MIAMGFKRRKIPRDLLLNPPPRRFQRWWLLPLLIGLLGLTAIAIQVVASAKAKAPQVTNVSYEESHRTSCVSVSQKKDPGT